MLLVSDVHDHSPIFFTSMTINDHQSINHSNYQPSERFRTSLVKNPAGTRPSWGREIHLSESLHVNDHNFIFNPLPITLCERTRRPVHSVNDIHPACDFSKARISRPIFCVATWSVEFDVVDHIEIKVWPLGLPARPTVYGSWATDGEYSGKSTWAIPD